MAMAQKRGVFDAEAATPVMAAYGRAIVSGQLLEVSLASLLGVFKRATDRDLTREEWVTFIDGLEAKTLGRLKNLFADLGAPKDQVDRLETALRTRNFLVHNCFREPERMALMSTEEGRVQLEDEFHRAEQEFRVGFRLTAGLLVRVAMVAGLDPNRAIDRTRSLLHREPRDRWERRVKAIVSDEQRRTTIEEQFHTLANLMSSQGDQT